MTAKNAQEQTNDAKKLNIVHDQERWIDEMNRSFKILRERKKLNSESLSQGSSLYVVKLSACDSRIAY